MVNKVQILITEDDSQLRETLADHLLGQGYEVTTAGDGNEAIPLLYGKKFHLVVLDLKMPYIDGFEVLKFIKSSFPETKVVILTAYGDLTNTEGCKRLGADEVIGKPYDLVQLFDTIESLVKE